MWERPAPVERAVGTGGQAKGTDRNMALVGRWEVVWPKERDTEAERLVSGLSMPLWDSQRPDRGMGRKQAITTTLLYRPS